jgi:alcohol dehydrogenase
VQFDESFPQRLSGADELMWRIEADPVLRSLWIKNVTITTGLVDTYSTPTLLRLVQSQQVSLDRFVTHYCEFDEAYDVFSRAGETGALKVVLTAT